MDDRRGEQTVSTASQDRAYRLNQRGPAAMPITKKVRAQVCGPGFADPSSRTQARASTTLVQAAAAGN